MSQINDVINAAIADTAGNANALNDKLLRYYQANGATSNDLQDAEYEFLIARGAGTVYGAELVANPNFTSGASWTLGSGFTISGNALRLSGSQVAPSDATNTGLFPALNGLSDIILDIKRIVPVGAFGITVRNLLTDISPVYQTAGRMRLRNVSINAGAIKIRQGAVGVEADITQLSILPITTLNSGTRDIQDMWEYYLRVVKGFTGSLDDMKFTYWVTGPRP